MPEDEYDVISRKMGGHRLMVARCEDGQVHLFSMSAEGELERLTPDAACGLIPTEVEPALDEDPMCPRCVAGAESWACGGMLSTPSRGASN